MEIQKTPQNGSHKCQFETETCYALGEFHVSNPIIQFRSIYNKYPGIEK